MERRLFLLLIGAVVLLRLVTLGASPLFDKTEGRYAEIGREMIESGDWVTPTLHGGEPFWGKPPLHFWATAASMAAFGRNEWGARIPGFVAWVLLLLLYHRAIRRWDGASEAGLATLVLASTALPFVIAGQVLLDATFTLTVTGALIAYGDIRNRGTGRYAFWIWLGLVMLAKGPVGLVLVAGAVLIDAALRRDASGIRNAFSPGIVLGAAISLPWYLLAERATPGFWRYFFWQEHVLRYVRKDYGDLYGHGHTAPYGLIWLIALAGLLPWTISILATLRARIAAAGPRPLTTGALRALAPGDALAIAWALSPLLFFTLSRSLSMPYAFPAFGGIAWLYARAARRTGPRALASSSLFTLAVLAIGGWFGARDIDLPALETGFVLVPIAAAFVTLLLRRPWIGREASRGIAVNALLFPAVGALLTFFALETVGEEKSTRIVRDRVRDLAPAQKARRICFFDGMPLSAEFYFEGRAVDLRGNSARVSALAAAPPGEILIVRKSKEQYLPGTVANSARLLAETRKYKIYEVP